MNKRTSISEFAEIIRGFLTNRSSGRLTRIAAIGHFSRKNFLPGKYWNMYLRTWLHLMMNVALEMPKSEFSELWNTLGEYVFDLAEQYGDQLNEAHSRKSGKRTNPLTNTEEDESDRR